MRNWGEAKTRTSRIEIIPMIDVMMFLLVFFVLISINVIPAMGLKTALPRSSQVQDLQARRHAIVTLAPGGELQLDGRAVTLEDLPGRLRALRQPGEKLSIVINGDRSAQLQRVVDVMDALKAAGFESFAIASQKK